MNYINFFFLDLVIELLENISINKYVIELKNGKQLPYGPIYAFNLIELETLKTYIKTHQKTRFIEYSKFLTNALILFNKKFNSNFYLYINY